jgi:hypothetical protein
MHEREATAVSNIKTNEYHAYMYMTPQYPITNPGL